MEVKGQRKCRNCKEFFTPDARNATRQHYCSKPECRDTSKKAAQQKWCNKNPSYFRGPLNVQRVREWRSKHPGYWKDNPELDVLEHADALQDASKPQESAMQAVILDSDQISEECWGPLQDTIEPILISCYESGQRIGGVVP